MKYPDYIKENRPKGTVVKLVNGQYYVYKATSKRVPDKKYPVQIVEGLVGKIDAAGFHPMNSVRVNTDTVIVRECGFTNYLLSFEKNYVSESHTQGTANTKIIYRSIISYLSPNSYLRDDKDLQIRSIDELVELYGISLNQRITSIQKFIGIPFAKLEPLKYICNIRMGDIILSSTLTEEQVKLIEELGIDERTIR